MLLCLAERLGVGHATAGGLDGYDVFYGQFWTEMYVMVIEVQICVLNVDYILVMLNTQKLGHEHEHSSTNTRTGTNAHELEHSSTSTTLSLIHI